MEKLPAHNLLQYHPDTLEHVRREFGFDKPGQMDAAIDLLDEWVRKQAHFIKKDFPRCYLERTIILDKGSVERAKPQLDKLSTIKTSSPQLFEKPDPRDNDYKILHEYYVDAALPKLTKDYFRIYAGKLLKDGINTKMLTHSFQFGTLILEHIRLNDYCSGYIVILDHRNINILDFAAKINILEFHQVVLLATEGYQMRLKGIHMLTNSKAIELLVRMFKQMLSKKLGDRIRVHTSEESLHEFVPKDVLPKEFGGELKSLIELNNDWVEELGKETNIADFREMSGAKVNESLRDESSKVRNDLLGISGSFRSLCID